MDLVVRKAWILPGRGLFAPGHWVAHHTSPRGYPDACTSVDGQIGGMPPNGASAEPAKNSKIVGTNSISLLESIKPQKNELKTNSKRTQKEVEISSVTVPIRPDEANSFGVSLPQLRPRGLNCREAVKERTVVILSDAKDLCILWRLNNLQPNAGILRFAQDDRYSLTSGSLRQIGKPRKDVKIVETNSTSLLESIKPLKNELKTNSDWSEKSAVDDADSAKLTRKLHHGDHREHGEEICSVPSVHSVVNLTEQSQNVYENKAPT